MKRRSFLAMLSLAPIAGVAVAKAALAGQQVGASIGLASSMGNVGEYRSAGIFRTSVATTNGPTGQGTYIAGQFAINDLRPYLFDAEGRCLNA